MSATSEIVEMRERVERAQDTLRRIGREIVAVAPDSGQCDSIGEIYYLLRECGVIEEKDGEQ